MDESGLEFMAFFHAQAVVACGHDGRKLQDGFLHPRATLTMIAAHCSPISPVNSNLGCDTTPPEAAGQRHVRASMLRGSVGLRRLQSRMYPSHSVIELQTNNRT